jgi:hypothetical protein
LEEKMKKILPLGIFIGVIVLGLAGYFIFVGNKKVIVLPGEIKKTEGESDKSFTGKLKDAMARNIPMKCEFKNNQMTGVGFIKGKKYYAEITQEGKQGYMILDDTCIWTWDKTNPQGVKFCMDKKEGEDKSIWDTEGNTSTEGDYKCSPAVFADSVFTPPANIKFSDMTEGFTGGEK